MSPTAPKALQVVAMIFIIGGVLALIETLVALTSSQLNLTFGVLGIFIGQGLLRFKPAWRTFALVVVCLELMSIFPFLALYILDIAFPLPIKFILNTESPLSIKFLGQPVSSASPSVVFVFAALMFALSLWQYRVLTRRDIVQLFDKAVG